MVSAAVQVAVGIAVISAPFLESFILKRTKGDARGPFKALCVLSILQLIINGLFLPETLPKKKRASITEFFKSVTSINPLSFLKVFFGECQVLKKLLMILTFQTCTDGKVTSDLFQLWSRNNLGWEAHIARNFSALWGMTVTAASAFVHPYLLKNFSTFAYSTIGNVSVWIGLTMHGLMEKGIFMWGGLPFLIGGVNGGSAHAIKALVLETARQKGYGNGEFSAWSNNMRALAQSLETLFLGMWYALCKENGIYQGTTWFFAGFLGAGLPQLLMLSMPRKVFEDPAAVKA